MMTPVTINQMKKGCCYIAEAPARFHLCLNFVVIILLLLLLLFYPIANL